MTNERLSELLDSLTRAGWQIALKPSDAVHISDRVMGRYGSIPEDYLRLLRRVSKLANAAETAWFLTEEDYNNDDPAFTGFHWNEWERMSIEWAEQDEDTESLKSTKAFWDRYLPIVSAVHSDYAYLALDTTTRPARVVYSYAPFWDEACEVSDSFAEYLESFVNALVQSPSNGHGGIERSFSDFF